MTLTASANRIDVRAIPPRERHPKIFSTFAGLGRGESMEIVNDHDPKPLYYQFEAEMPATFSWEYLETGPETWRVRITKVQPQQKSHGNGSCCGSCGGH